MLLNHTLCTVIKSYIMFLFASVIYIKRTAASGIFNDSIEIYYLLRENM